MPEREYQLLPPIETDIPPPRERRQVLVGGRAHMNIPLDHSRIKQVHATFDILTGSATAEMSGLRDCLVFTTFRKLL